MGINLFKTVTELPIHRRVKDKEINKLLDELLRNINKKSNAISSKKEIARAWHKLIISVYLVEDIKKEE